MSHQFNKSREQNALVLSQLLEERNPEIPPGTYPVIIQIEPTNTCNARCPLCPTGIGTLDRKPAMLGNEIFKKIIDETKAFTSEVALWNYGEPFLNHDHTK